MIEFQGVAKSYGNFFGDSAPALSDMTFRVERGECFAIVGPNGAGKSTILGLILGYLRADRGEIRVHGQLPRAYVRAHGIGYLPEFVELPGRWSVPDALRRLGTLDGLKGRDLTDRIRTAVERVDLAEHAGKRIKALSRGNRQRVGIAQMLLHPRSILLMDEPTSGLDPMWRARFRELLKELRAEDPARTIILSSHDLHEIERIADRVALIDRGRLREIIDLGHTEQRPDYLIRVSGPVPLDEYVKSAIVMDGAWRVAAPDKRELSRELALYLAAGGVLHALLPEIPTLEQVVRKAFARDAAAGPNGDRSSPQGAAVGPTGAAESGRPGTRR